MNNTLTRTDKADLAEREERIALRRRLRLDGLGRLLRAWENSGADLQRADVRAMIAAGIAPPVLPLPDLHADARRARVQGAPDGVRPPVAGVIPFTSAAHEHTEPFVDVTVTPGASEAPLAGSPFSIPSYGYLRSIWIVVEATGGTLGAGALAADFPFNLFSNIQLTDTNGAPIFGPLDGYATLQQNIYGGASSSPVGDPRALPWYDATINADFALRVPLEISHRDGMGALANQNSAAAYKLYLTVNPSTVIYSTAPTTGAAFRIRVFAECWTIPDDQDLLGRPQAQVPPRLGTTQYVSSQLLPTSAGQNTLRLTRVGNLFRSLLFIARTTAAGTPRSDAVFPDPVTLQWDARNIHDSALQRYLTGVLMREKVPDLVARDTGVFAFPFNTSDHNSIGDDSPTFWWPTVQSSRIELRGSVVTAGNIQAVTTDVAPVEVSPEERYELESSTGFTPERGTPVRR